MAALVEIPVLETERLRLRGLKATDHPFMSELWANPEVVRFITGKPQSPQECWFKILSQTGLWAILGYGYWALEERSTGQIIGHLGFADFKRELEPSIEGIPELGWVLSPSFQGKGYATEGIRACLDWSDQMLKAKRIVCLIHPENAPSIRVAEKNSFVEFARPRFAGEQSILMERIRPNEFAPARSS